MEQWTNHLGCKHAYKMSEILLAERTIIEVESSFSGLEFTSWPPWLRWLFWRMNIHPSHAASS